MDGKRRSIFPITDWIKFLMEAKKEFFALFGLRSSKRYGREDFELLKTLGQGAFGRVYLSKMTKTGKFYAIKVMGKQQIVKSGQIRHALNEKRVLQAINFPLCVYLEYSFLDNSYMYLCLPFITGGEMFTHLQRMRRFNEPLSKFYGAQVLLAFEYLHYCDALYRDLKPENILIDDRGYLKITDFGFCKIVKGRTYSLCGTPEYLAPEVILNRGYGKSVDWWTYGVLLYEMNAGFPPFHASDPMMIYERAVHAMYKIPNTFSSSLTDLVQNLLQVDLSRRYGILKNGINDIKGHPWYKDMNWLALLNSKTNAPFIPAVRGAGDASNFENYQEIKMEVNKIDRFAAQFAEF